MKKANQIGIGPGYIVLYLGASSGTTVSHVSDIIGEKGSVFSLILGLIFWWQVNAENPNYAKTGFNPEDSMGDKNKINSDDKSGFNL